ncbi:ABC transporter permease [Levilactobacillus brevis]|uniref:ABC transporter permease n=1 Tax=Levilactobacillus brevis TaxID=1580 RepID=UPI0031DDCAC2
MKKWFKHPLAYVTIILAMVCGLIFVLAAVPGFNKLPSGTQNLRVVVLDQDQSSVSKNIATHLENKLPFKMVTATSFANAKRQLNTRQAALIIQIDKGFYQRVTRGQAPKLTYTVNQSNGLLQNMVTKNVTTQVTTQVASQLTTVKVTQMLAQSAGKALMQKQQAVAKQQVKQQLQAALAKSPQLAQQPAQLKKLQQQAIARVKRQQQQRLMPQVKKQAAATAATLTGQVATTTTKLHALPTNYQYQFAPMFLNLGAYLGIMLMSLVLTLMFMSARHVIGKWSALLAVQLNGFIGVLVAPLVTLGTLRCLISFSSSAFWQLFGVQVLFGLAVFEFTLAIAFLCGGLPSMILQLPLLVSQVVASGAIIPRPALNGFYRWLSTHTPMSQGVYSTFNALYGGANSGYTSALWWLISLSLLAVILIGWLGYRSTKTNPLSRLVPFTAGN